MVYILCIILFCVGLLGVVTRRNLIKIILGVKVIEYAVNLMLVLIGYRAGGIAPIRDRSMSAATFVHGSVDPFPQAMVLTAIVVGLGVLALLTAIAIRLYHKYGTYDITRIKRLRG